MRICRLEGKEEKKGGLSEEALEQGGGAVMVLEFYELLYQISYTLVFCSLFHSAWLY